MADVDRDEGGERRRLTSAEYAEMAADYAANPPTADEVIAITVFPGSVRPESRLHQALAEDDENEAATAAADKRRINLLNEVAAEAEAAAYAPGEDDGVPLPPHVKVSRPNRAGSKVLEVRLKPEEVAAIERIAAGRKLPVSTVAREKLLELVVAEAGDVRSQIFYAANEIKRLAERLDQRAP